MDLIATKKFILFFVPDLPKRATATVVVAKGEEQYHPPLRTRREVNT